MRPQATLHGIIEYSLRAGENLFSGRTLPAGRMLPMPGIVCSCPICPCDFHLPCYSEIDECGLNTDNCDETLATCLNTPAGSFTCTCITGYTGNGNVGTCIGECCGVSAV